MYDYRKIKEELAQEYLCYSPKSANLQESAKEVMIDGGNHALRLIQPFPPRIRAAKGAYIDDIDSHHILDFWQGHHANILGHNPEVITSKLADAFTNHWGLISGFTDEIQVEVAELFCQQTGCEKVRFTTSGTLATMYAMLLSKAFTGRDIVLKVGGGWHGAQPWGLKGVSYHTNSSLGFQAVESDGLHETIGREIIVTRFNQPDLLTEIFQKYGDRIACFIIEPFIGAGGLMWATKDFIHTARELTTKHGSILIFDEVIAGFRFRAGDTGRMFGVQPDLATFGKIIGGGMPIAAVGGKSEIMKLSGREGGKKVKFSGGTYSAHPASMLAAKTMLEYLIKEESSIYPYLEDLGNKIRIKVVEAYAKENILAICTGYGQDGLPGSSINMVVFPYNEDFHLNAPEDIYNPAVCDVDLGNDVIQLALLLEDIHVVHGLGSLSVTHTENDINCLSEAIQKTAYKINKLKMK